MKLFRIFAILAFSLMLFSCSENAQKDHSKSITSKNIIEVIDFHSTHRCMTCNLIEANTKFTLNTYFVKELKSGEITFQSVNVDEEANYPKAEKFEASGTSLFLNVIVNGKETIIDLTNFAFAEARDKNAFSGELKTKIEEQLKKL